PGRRVRFCVGRAAASGAAAGRVPRGWAERLVWSLDELLATAVQGEGVVADHLDEPGDSELAVAGAIEKLDEVVVGVGAGVAQPILELPEQPSQVVGLVGVQQHHRVVVGVRGGHWPNRPQPLVPGWTEWASSAMTTSVTAPGPARWSQIEARSASANRPAIAARPRASSTRRAPNTAASSTAWCIF